MIELIKYFFYIVSKKSWKNFAAFIAFFAKLFLKWFFEISKPAADDMLSIEHSAGIELFARNQLFILASKGCQLNFYISAASGFLRKSKQLV